MILSALDRFFSEQVPLLPGDLLVVAFSGGADSTALLWGLDRLAAGRQLRVHAVHLDHGLDRRSGRRAGAAAEISRRLGVPIEVEELPVRRQCRRGESLEAAARRLRYARLEELRQRLGARLVATAHHLDDQVETLVMRLLRGSGVEGLSGIAARRGNLVRPLLGLRRRELRKAVAEHGLSPVEDPSNLDLRHPRNRVRHLLLPRLSEQEPELAERVRRLALAAGAVRTVIEGRLETRLEPEATDRGADILLRELERLPQQLWPFALGMLQRRAGAPYPAGRDAREELKRQLRRGSRVGCDCGDGWRWEVSKGRLRLHESRSVMGPFAYTLEVPGEVVVEELGVTVGLRPAATAPWMFETSPRRVGLSLPLKPGDRVTVRNRRPGDRMRPLGCTYSRRLKDVFIDRGVERQERDRLPLLCLDDRVAWVPGVTIDNDFRLPGSNNVWLAEIKKP